MRPMGDVGGHQVVDRADRLERRHRAGDTQGRQGVGVPELEQLHGPLDVGEAAAADPNNPSLVQQFPLVGEILARFGNDAAAGQAALQSAVQNATGEVFGNTFLVAAVMVAFTLVTASFLPRRHEESHLLDDADVAPPVILH